MLSIRDSVAYSHSNAYWRRVLDRSLRFARPAPLRIAAAADLHFALDDLVKAFQPGA